MKTGLQQGFIDERQVIVNAISHPPRLLHRKSIQRAGSGTRDPPLRITSIDNSDKDVLYSCGKK